MDESAPPGTFLSKILTQLPKFSSFKVCTQSTLKDTEPRKSKNIISLWETHQCTGRDGMLCLKQQNMFPKNLLHQAHKTTQILHKRSNNHSWSENYLALISYISIMKLFTHQFQITCDIKEILCIRVKLTKHCLLAHSQFQICHNNMIPDSINCTI